MRTLPNARLYVLAAACAALLSPSPAPAQVSVQFHWGDDEYHRIDGSHLLRGRQYQTMASLAHYLDETVQELNEQAYRASRGDRSQWRLLASVSDFARRTHDFHFRMDSYLDSPWNVPREVDDLSRRAHNVSRRIHEAQLFPHTYELWNDTVDVLNRMQQVLHGAEVEVPPPHEHHTEGSRWDPHRDADRNGNGIPDRRER